MARRLLPGSLRAQLALAIALFVAIPAVYGIAVGLWIERALDPERPSRSGWQAYLPLAVFALLGPFGVIMLLVLLAGCFVWTAVPALGRIWAAAPVVWIGRVVAAAAFVVSVAELVDAHFDLRPGAFREYLKLHRPIYQKTAAYGHFGRDDHDFTWERTDKAAALREAAGLGAAPAGV